jgi:serine/threonine protein kinase
MERYVRDWSPTTHAELIVLVILFLLNDLPDDHLETLGQLLRRSFETAGCVDRSAFIDYARNFLAFPKADTRRGQSPVALCRLTGAVFSSLPTAVRHIPLSPSDSDSGLKIIGILTEIMNLLYCTHPAIVKLVGWTYMANGEFVVATELFDRQLHPGLTATEKMRVLYGCARGFARLHEMGVCHGDVRPVNIFLDSDNLPKIGQLGFDRRTFAETMATIAYRAPESLRQCYGKEADVYSFGVVCWGLLVGEEWRVPDGIASPAEYLQFLRANKICVDRLPRDIVTEALVNLVELMLSVDPANRPNFTTIAAKLEQERFWLRGTDEAAFRPYIEAITREESHLNDEDIPEWRLCIEQRGRVPAVLERMAGKDLSQQVVEGVRFVCGGDAAADQVALLVQQSLAEYERIDSRFVNPNVKEEFADME